MAKLIPLKDIPFEAREIEADARRRLRAAGEDVLAAAHYEIHDAEGCYSGAYPDTLGWAVTERAAKSLTNRVVTMPGGTCHHDLAYTVE